jgi:hypothetical protein
MPYPVLAFALAGAIAMSPEPAAPSTPLVPPDPPSSGPSGHLRPSIESLMLDYEAQSKALKAEMADLQKSDGGKLTPEHRTYVQQKLIALLDAFHSALQKDDPMSVNADGRPAR